MDTKKLRDSDLEDIIHRFSVMRDRANDVIELAQEIADVRDDIKSRHENIEYAIEENDPEEVERNQKLIAESEKDLERLQAKLDQEFYGVRLDFYVESVDDLL